MLCQETGDTKEVWFSQGLLWYSISGYYSLASCVCGCVRVSLCMFKLDVTQLYELQSSDLGWYTGPEGQSWTLEVLDSQAFAFGFSVT